MAFTHPDLHEPALKSLVDNLARHLKAHPLPASPPKRAAVQELVAATLGWPNWHAAIAAVRAKAALPQPAATDPWKIPAKHLVCRDFSLNLGQLRWSEKDDKVWRVPVKDIAAHARVVGTEAARRAFFEELARINPARPLLLVQGPASLPLRRWDGDSAPALSFEECLATQPGSVIVERAAEAILRGDRPNSMWKGRAIALFSAVALALVHLRDHHKLDLTIEVLGDHFLLENIRQLERRPDLTPPLAQALAAYLGSLPGYDDQAPRQSATTLEQHGYLQMHLATLLGELPGSPKALSRVWWPQSSSTPARACVSWGQTEPSPTHLQAVMNALEDWTARHAGGLVVLDGMAPASPLWEALVLRLPQWQDRKVGAWLGVAMKDDLPEGALRERLLGRIKGFVLVKA